VAVARHLAFATPGSRDKPQLKKALEQLREGDELVVWKLDRLPTVPEDILSTTPW
jgi:DNA invertase Pin-like site-specific DNA recombinase